MSNQLTTKEFFQRDVVKNKMEELLGKRAPQFITSALQIVNNNALLSKASPESVFNSVVMAATLDLPINQNLGYAYIVPYKGQAQFQMGWKGFVQLAQRSKEYLKINVTEVYENQFKSFNQLTEDLDVDFLIEGSGEIVGYAAYFRLANGFEKTSYWSREKVEKHASKYSQAYKSATGISPWKDADQFHEMAKKTVLKNTLSKWGVLSIEMQKATVADQAVIKNPDNLDIQFIDNEAEKINKEEERIRLMIEDVKSVKEAKDLQEAFIADKVVLSPENYDLLTSKMSA